jgi:hypothetical protein
MSRRRSSKFLLATFVFALACAGPTSPAQTIAGLQRGLKVDEHQAAAPSGHRYVVAIGINQYQHWQHLATAVSDATGFAQLLHSDFAYEMIAPPLTEQRATRQGIESLIDDTLRSKLSPDDDLVVFFAGHGTTRTDTVGGVTSKVGFLVPYEASAPGGTSERWSDYLEVDEFLRKISSLPARHILVILDSCHSGLALGRSVRTERGDGRFEADMQSRVSRKVITSAQGDQTAADQGQLPDHSLFTGALIEGLRKGDADIFRTGFVTSSQLGMYVQGVVSRSEGSRQTPAFGGFDRDDEGELILPLHGAPMPRASLSNVSSSPPPDLQPGGDNRSRAGRDSSAPSESLDDLEVQLDSIDSRAQAADQSITHLQQTMQRSGMSLRGDVVGEAASLKINLRKAHEAVTARDAQQAARFAALAENDLKKLETFLGR